jgi:hypothetical protein
MLILTTHERDELRAAMLRADELQAAGVIEVRQHVQGVRWTERVHLHRHHKPTGRRATVAVEVLR